MGSTTASSVDKSSKKFKCTSCPKTFRRQNELASHQQVHFKVSAPLVKKLKRMREISSIQRKIAQQARLKNQERERKKKQNQRKNEKFRAEENLHKKKKMKEMRQN